MFLLFANPHHPHHPYNKQTSITPQTNTHTQRAAELGQADAQHRLACAYATGILHGGPGGLVPMDAGKGLLLEYVSALSGNAEANVGMGYRCVYVYVFVYVCLYACVCVCVCACVNCRFLTFHLSPICSRPHLFSSLTHLPHTHSYTQICARYWST